ncbi:MAG: hypothetical protein Q7R57_08680 [Dehalococcoidales bacterium]|nr:hypothetical protein [Dehalococcoidales bacterium]
MPEPTKFSSVRRTLVRSVYAETLLENFFVAAVVSVLAIRLYLQLSGYPRITIGGLHISHVMMGGLGMMVALVILLGFLNRTARDFAAIIGGIGFGVFIDELGKFITRDNDYFYEPTIALIYIAFVLLFYFIRTIARRQVLSREERLANVFEIARQAALNGLTPEESQLALILLEGEHDATARNLRAILAQTPPAGSSRTLLTRLKELLNRFYEHVTASRWFAGATVAFFAIVAISSLSSLVAIVYWSWALGLWTGGGVLILGALFWSRQTRVRYLNIGVTVAIVTISILLTWAILGRLKQTPLSLLDWAQLVFPTLSGAIIVMGLLLMPVSRLRAYQMFRRAILTSIFLTQVLSFYAQQFLALAGLIVNIMILLALRYMISHEEAKSQANSPDLE